MPKKPTLLSAFTGAGGLDLGFELAGFRVIGCIEFDRDAARTIKLNRKHWRLLEPGDINQLAPQLSLAEMSLEPGELDVLAGGPPCQPFSKAAQWTEKGMRGFADPRSDCLRAFLSLIERMMPRVVLIENVPGFASGPNSAVPLMESELSRINKLSGTSYYLQKREIDTAEFGVPQRRKRVILIARRDGEPFVWPEPTHAEPVTAYDALARVRISCPPVAKGRWGPLLPSIPEGQNYLWHTEFGGGRPLFGYRTRFWSFLLKLAKAEPAWTLSASPGPSTGPFHWENRPLAIEEMLRLQSFPTSWKVAGAYRNQVKQIGNATPPLLGEILGRALGEQVFGLSYKKPLELAIPRRRRVPPPEEVREVPEQYRTLEGKHQRHPGTGKGPRPRRSEVGTEKEPLLPLVAKDE